MKVQQFIDYLNEEIKLGNVKLDDTILGEYQEDIGEVEGVYRVSESTISIYVEI